MAKKRKWSGKAKLFVKRYNAYRKAHKARIAALRKRGLEPYYNATTGDDGSIPLTYREYKEIYMEEYNDRSKEVKKGERKSLGNINSKIISDQVYELSEKQAYSIFDYMRTLSDEERAQIGFNYKNINTAIMRIREGSFVRQNLSLWDKIKARRKELFEQGFTKEEINGKGDKRGIISSEFFYPQEDEEGMEVDA